LSRAFNQEISQVTAVIDLYSTSAKDRDTVFYFLDFHEIKESTKNIQKPVTDLPEFGQPTQFESQKAFNCSEEDALHWWRLDVS
jgi:hypothetical protein